jgi:hypothetical protein
MNIKEKIKQGVFNFSQIKKFVNHLQGNNCRTHSCQINRGGASNPGMWERVTRITSPLSETQAQLDVFNSQCCRTFSTFVTHMYDTSKHPTLICECALLKYKQCTMWSPCPVYVLNILPSSLSFTQGCVKGG